MCGDFDDFFDDLEMQDFAIIGGVLGFVEEQIEEGEKIQKEIDEDEIENLEDIINDDDDINPY